MTLPTLFDRIKEFSTSTGTGNFTLTGAQPGGFQTWSTIGVGNTHPYCIQNTTAAEWETGLGTLLNATTLVRTTVHESSNGNSLVNFSAGTKDVFGVDDANYLNTLAAGGGGSGTVTSVAILGPSSIISWINTPITTSGTLTALLTNQSANTVFAGPTSGGANTPTFRALVTADIASVAATSVSNSDGTLTISPTTGAVVASLNVGHANTWTGQQTFNTSPPTAPWGSGTTANERFGAGSGRNAATGDFNLVLGSQAGSALTTGSNNLFLGYQSGLVATTASANVFVGDLTGSSITTGSSNFLMGQAAGQSLTTGSSNVCLGAAAGLSITTVNGCVFIGAVAGELATGDSNIGIGGSALAIATGDGNLAIGSSAASGITSGGQNVVIGMGGATSFPLGNELTTGSNSILIGRRACCDNFSNTIAIGSNVKNDGRMATAAFQAVFHTAAASGDSPTFCLSGFATGNTFRHLARTITEWVVSTDASRTARMRLCAMDYNCSDDNTTVREGLRIEANGTVALVGFFATTAVVQQSGDVATALVNYGLLTGPSYGTQGRATAQTAANASVATTTVGAADGSYLISANVLITTSVTHSFTVTCSYTDESNTARVLTLNFSQLTGVFVTTLTNILGASAYEGVPVHIRAKAGTAITIASTGTFTSVTYNIEGHITQIA